jgi:hypothetical protein
MSRMREQAIKLARNVESSSYYDNIAMLDVSLKDLYKGESL